MKLKAVLIILFVCCISSAIAHGEITISGQVVDSVSSQSVPCATIRISSYDAPDKAVALFACDIDGYFSTILPKNGDYYLHISSIGYSPLEKVVALEDGSILSFQMQENSTALGEVTVTAQRPLIKVDSDKIVYNIQDDSDSKVSNTLDMLRKVPMVTVDGDDNIQLKGSGQFKIYLDGRPSGLLSSNPSDVLKSIPASSIKEIEVITDPGAKYDAEGVSGIINIITIKHTIDGYSSAITAEANTANTYGLGTFLSLKTGKFGMTLNYSYENEREPDSDIESTRIMTHDDVNHLLTQSGTQYEKEYSHRGSLEGSFEIDSLNLITIDANLYRKNQHEFTDMKVALYDIAHNPIYSYSRHNENKPVMGSVEINANYQHETQLIGEVLTASYRFTNDPNDDENLLNITNSINYNNTSLWDTNKAKTNEHTFQLDYLRPFSNHEVEVGAKYILRQTDSEIHHQLFDQQTNQWYEDLDNSVDFNHTQHIYSAYLGGNFKWGNFGLKTGLRAEGTSLSIKYKNDSDRNFNSNFVDVVPNIVTSYAISASQQLRLGYNMRIQRAGIDHLNPYVDESDPLNISYGNPNLKSEKSHSVNLNYSLYTSTFNLNASLSYMFVNNSIEQYTFISPENDMVSVSTYGNIGKRSYTGLFLYLNWTPVSWFRFYMNGSVDYTQLKSPQNNLSNNGWSGRVFAGTQFGLPFDSRIGLNVGYMLPTISLQGERGDFLTHTISLSKDFMQKKLSVSLYCKSPLCRTWEMTTTTYNKSFVLHETEYKVMREFGLTLSYRFGNLSGSTKKIKRGIVNDDIIESEDSE